MKFNKMVLDNFKVYSGRTEIEFNDGINLLVANNGHGKSTLIQVIRVLLFGINSATNMETLVNWNSDQKRFYLALDFTFENDNYFTDFDYDKTRSQSSIRRVLKNGELIVDGADAVKKYFADLFDINLMDNSLFARQGVNNIIDCTNSERSEVLKKIKDVDFSKQIKEEIEPQIVKEESESTEVEVQIRTLENKSYELEELYPLPFTKEELESKKVSIGGLKNDLKAAEIQNEKIKQIQEKLNEKTSELAALKSSLESKELKINQLQSDKENAELTKIENKADSYREALNNLPSLKDEEIRNEKEIFNNKKESLENIISQLKKTLDDYKIERVLPFDTTELEEIKEYLINKRYELKTLEDKEKNSNSGVCPTCGRPFDESHEHEDFSSQIQKLESDIKKLESKKEKLEKEKNENETLIHNNDVLKENRAETKSELSNTEQRLENLNESFDSSINQIEKRYEEKEVTLTEAVTTAEQSFVEQSNLIKDKIETISQYISDINLEISKIKSDVTLLEADITTIEAKILKEGSFIKTDELESKISEIENNIKNYDSIIHKNEEIEKHNKKIEEDKLLDTRSIKRLVKKQDKIKERIIQLKEAKALMIKEIPAYIISQSIKEIEDGINNFVDSIYEKSLNVEFKLQKSAIAMNYGGKNKIAVKDGLSGAEKKLVQIGFIAKFNKDLGLNCILLDEPDEGVSESNSEMLFEMVGDMTKEFSQVFITTHNKRMKEYLLNNYESNIVSLGSE